jgi:hypothetical protein
MSRTTRRPRRAVSWARAVPKLQSLTGR